MSPEHKLHIVKALQRQGAVVAMTGESGAVVLPLPLLATQILWVNLVSDGAPALALGVDPPDANMDSKPRPHGEGVITGRMWRSIVLIGVVMAIGTLLVLDSSLPGGLLDGSGDIRYAQTMTFTTIVFFSLFTVFAVRSDEQSAFVGMFSNKWLWGCIAIARSAGRHHIRALLAAGVLDGAVEHYRLVEVRCSSKLGPVADRRRQASCASSPQVIVHPVSLKPDVA